MKVSIIMPAYNEAATIAEMISKVQAVDVGFSKEIVIVDDASVDGTRNALNAFREVQDVRVIFHERNRGKGAAIRTALAHVTGDIVVIQDADLEYDPEDPHVSFAQLLVGRRTWCMEIASMERRIEFCISGTLSGMEC